MTPGEGAGERGRDVVVTIDGPAGAGKSTVARRLAERLGFAYVNSGAIYRAIAWRVSRGAPVETVLRSLSVEFVPLRAGARACRRPGRHRPALHAGGERAGRHAVPARGRPAFADRLQRKAAARGPVVVEGRDAGTVVFPEAECKFYLDASPDARARRRFAEQRAGGGGADLEVIRTAIAARDDADRTRSVAPLAQSADATYVDSSDMTVDEVVELMAKEVERACSTRS